MEQDFIERENTVRDYLRGIFRRRAIVIATCLTTLCAVSVGLALKTRVYTAQVKMLIQANKNIESPFYRTIADFRTSEITMTQSEIVKSNPVIERVVNSLKLDELPLDQEKQFASPLKDILIDVKTAKLLKKTAKMADQERKDFLFHKAVRDLKKRIKVEPVRDTDLFTINVSAFTGKEAARIANVVSRSYCMFDLEQQLAELKQQYGEKHLSVVQLKNNIEKLDKALTGESLPNIEAIGPASVKIIEQATEPPEPAGKSKALVLALALFLSIAMGVVLAFFFDYFDPTLKSPRDIQSFLKMPYLGYVPCVRSISGNSIVFVRRAVNTAAALVCLLLVLYIVLSVLGVDRGNPVAAFVIAVLAPLLALARGVAYGQLVVPAGAIVVIAAANYFISRLLERLKKQALKSSTALKDFKKQNHYIRAFQNLSQQIYFSMKGNEHTSVLATSALSQEGTSTVLSNLARYLASSGKKVLLIDANARRPMIHKLFRLTNALGLTDVLEDKAVLSDAVQEAGDKLFVLTAGKTGHAGLNFPDTERFSSLIEQAEKKYEIVLIDCPNLKDFKDTPALSAYVSGIILIVSEGKARKEVLKASLEALQKKQARFIGAVLNNRTFAIPGVIYERA